MLEFPMLQPARFWISSPIPWPLHHGEITWNSLSSNWKQGAGKQKKILFSLLPIQKWIYHFTCSVTNLLTVFGETFLPHLSLNSIPRIPTSICFLFPWVPRACSHAPRNSTCRADAGGMSRGSRRQLLLSNNRWRDVPASCETSGRRDGSRDFRNDTSSKMDYR